MSKPEITETVWQQLNADLKAFIYSKVGNVPDTDDILQELYIKMHENIGTLKDGTKIKSWIYRIARNLIIDHFRDDKRRQRTMKSGKAMSVSSKPGKFMDIAINDMISMMDDMPPEYCEALCLTEIESMSQKEYAEMKGISYSGARSRVQRARIMLKDLLLKCCHYQFDRYGTVYDIRQECCCCKVH